MEFVFFVGILIFIFIMGIFIYNSLISKKNQVKNAESSIDVMLKKRFDLIPNLVESVKSYMKYETSVLTELTELRTKSLIGDLNGEQKVKLDKQLSDALSRFNVMVEAYPDLKASDNFIMLQRSINEVEEQISASRRAFNASVTELNNAIEMFPSNLFAGPMGLQRHAFFDIPDAERKNLNVGNLLDNS
ncbi:LemA family protein [Vibrio sp. Of7-15]|uniref:LemA family protein n=1 Tax=Vibrio sp. Of7-15 TaxID=2724879 RepID=UPI001EF3A6FA|nr:LemA family protein [Vibrio sp. Of7-15]MCG7499986.1 LemA family protein [Vibrio sp. Of7-15]